LVKYSEVLIDNKDSLFIKMIEFYSSIFRNQGPHKKEKEKRKGKNCDKIKFFYKVQFFCHFYPIFCDFKGYNLPPNHANIFFYKCRQFNSPLILPSDNLFK
jgi:hypothetical protein